MPRTNRAVSDWGCNLIVVDVVVVAAATIPTQISLLTGVAVGVPTPATAPCDAQQISSLVFDDRHAAVDDE